MTTFIIDLKKTYKSFLLLPEEVRTHTLEIPSEATLKDLTRIANELFSNIGHEHLAAYKSKGTPASDLSDYSCITLESYSHYFATDCEEFEYDEGVENVFWAQPKDITKKPLKINASNFQSYKSLQFRQGRDFEFLEFFVMLADALEPVNKLGYPNVTVDLESKWNAFVENTEILGEFVRNPKIYVDTPKYNLIYRLDNKNRIKALGGEYFTRDEFADQIQATRSWVDFLFENYCVKWVHAYDGKDMNYCIHQDDLYLHESLAYRAFLLHAANVSSKALDVFLSTFFDSISCTPREFLINIAQEKFKSKRDVMASLEPIIYELERFVKVMCHIEKFTWDDAFRKEWQARNIKNGKSMTQLRHY